MRFTKDHEWIRLEGEVATVGITEFAAGQLGDIVYVELPEVGRTVSRGEAFAVVESVKAASDVFAPVSGEVVDANPALGSAPETVNGDAENAGWLARIRLADPGELDGLMDRTAYEIFLEGR